MVLTCSAHLFVTDMIAVLIFGSTNHEAPRYAVFEATFHSHANRYVKMRMGIVRISDCRQYSLYVHDAVTQGHDIQ